MPSHRGGTFMMERPARTSTSRPKSSETDPPAANQPLHDKKAARPTKSGSAPRGKPDGEVDTRR